MKKFIQLTDSLTKNPIVINADEIFRLNTILRDGGKITQIEYRLNNKSNDYVDEDLTLIKNMIYE